jgi:hypothetical protein
LTTTFTSTHSELPQNFLPARLVVHSTASINTCISTYVRICARCNPYALEFCISFLGLGTSHQGAVRMLIYISCRRTALRLRPDENRESAGAEAQQTDKKIAVRILRDSSLLHMSTRLRIQTSKRLFAGRIVDQQKKNRLDTPPASSTSATSIHLLVRRKGYELKYPCPVRVAGRP